MLAAAANVPVVSHRSKRAHEDAFIESSASNDQALRSLRPISAKRLKLVLASPTPITHHDNDWSRAGSLSPTEPAADKIIALRCANLACGLAALDERFTRITPEPEVPQVKPKLSLGLAIPLFAPK